MHKNKKPKEKDAGAWISLSELVRQAIPREGKVAAEVIRLSNYVKDENWEKVFPKRLFRINDVPISAAENRKLLGLSNKEGKLFIRNLWFLHRFFGMPKRVIRFLNEPDQRPKLFKDRLLELEVTSEQYRRCFAAAPEVEAKIQQFSPTETDLYATVEAAPASTSKSADVAVGWGVAVVDFIRQVEERASYKEGAPEDACEKALYFLELGRPDIAQNIATEALDENPDNPVALFANALLLVHKQQHHLGVAFVHSTLHDPSLIPGTGEEQWLVERYETEMKEAYHAAERAFQLLLHSWKNWPEEFKISASRFHPEMWKDKVEDLVLGIAAERQDLTGNPFGTVSERTREWHAIVSELLQEISREHRLIRLCLNVGSLRNFIVVANALWPEGAAKCIADLQIAIEKQKGEPFHWGNEDTRIKLPISIHPSIAQSLLPLLNDRKFCAAVLRCADVQDGIDLLLRIEVDGERERHDQELARRSLNVRQLIVTQSKSLKSLSNCLKLCRPFAERNWPATPTGRVLRACWRYSVIRLLVEISWLRLDAGESSEAIKCICSAVDLVQAWFEDVTSKDAMAEFLDEDECGETEFLGDWLRRMPNMITDSESLDEAQPRPFGLREGLVVPKEFGAWVSAGQGNGQPLFKAYCEWLGGAFPEAASVREKIHMLPGSKTES